MRPSCNFLLHAEVPLRGPAGAGGVASGLDPDVGAVDQPLEMVAGHVGVQGEGPGDLRFAVAPWDGNGRAGRCHGGVGSPNAAATAATAALNRPSFRSGRSLGLRGDRSGAHPR